MNPTKINMNEINHKYENSRPISNLSKEKENEELNEEQEYEEQININNYFENDNTDNNENNSSVNSQGKKPIYVMSLQLDDGKIAKIKIYSDSDPNELSQAFCLKNNLDPQAAEYLASQIQTLIEQFNNNENGENENEENGEENFENIQIEDEEDDND